jgi:hypothetical protein
MDWFKHHFPSYPLEDPRSFRRARRNEAADSPGPYLVALAFAVGVLGFTIVFTGVPAIPMVQIGTTFVVLALVSRRIRERPTKPTSRVGRWAKRITRGLDRVWGLEFYCLAALSALVWLEAGSILRLDFAGGVVNVLEAAIWWYPMWEHVAGPQGVATFVLLLASGWTFWVLLGLHPDEEPWLN